MEMTKKAIQDLCKQHSLYRTPHLNDKLYLNFQGFVKIQNLEVYTGLKALFLEGNALSTLEGLPPLEELKCMYLQQNRIRVIDDLSHLPNLNTLNVSCNDIHTIAGLSGCSLETLICTHNYLEDVASVEHLAQCTQLQTIDLQNNKIDDVKVLDILARLPNLKCLYLKGNPMVSKVKQYRHTMISRIPSLTYLDDRPVFPDEHEVVQAWARDGLQGERVARDQIAARKKQRDTRNYEFMQAIRAEAFREKRERIGLPPGDTDPYLDQFSDSEWDVPEDPPELQEARKKLDMHISCASQGVSTDGSDRIPAVPTVMETDPEEYSELLSNLDMGSGALDSGQMNPSMAKAAAQLNATLQRTGAAIADAPIPTLECLDASTCSSLHDLD
eukprot:jgi/Ulvmu1/4883/UM020_0169.1